MNVLSEIVLFEALSSIHCCRNHMSPWESVSCQRKRFCKTSFPFALQSAPQFAPDEGTFVPHWNKEQANERLRTVSGPLSHSIAFTEEFQVVPSVQQAWNARMVVCIYASVEIQARRESRFPILTYCSLSTHTRHVFILTWRVYVHRTDDDTELWEWESRCDPHDL